MKRVSWDSRTLAKDRWTDLSAQKWCCTGTDCCMYSTYIVSGSGTAVLRLVEEGRGSSGLSMTGLCYLLCQCQEVIGHRAASRVPFHTTATSIKTVLEEVSGKLPCTDTAFRWRCSDTVWSYHQYMLEHVKTVLACMMYQPATCTAVASQVFKSIHNSALCLRSACPEGLVGVTHGYATIAMSR